MKASSDLSTIAINTIYTRVRNHMMIPPLLNRMELIVSGERVWKIRQRMRQ